jgi:hypothetical protein
VTVPVADRRRRRTRALGALTGAVLVVAAVALLGALHGSEPRAEAGGHPLPPAVSPEQLAARSGVRVVRVSTTGGGGLLDVRYQVVNPDAAASLHDRDAPPAVVDETRGSVIDTLYMGHSHSGKFRAGATYYLIFANPGNLVRSGDPVAIVLGKARLEHVRVR